MIKSIEESVVIALDGPDKEIFPFLPYILKDLWEIGSNPDIILNSIKKHRTNYTSLKILDLGCGKGAVSIKLAEKLGCTCLGIDAMPEFIEEAQQRAAALGVSKLCTFEVNDIRTRIKTTPMFDIIILGSIGPVFGDYYTTLSILSGSLKNSGIIIIDDGYIEQDSDFVHPLVIKKDIIIQQIEASGMVLIDEEIIQRDDIKESDDFIFEKIKKRCGELMIKYPDKKHLFENYVKNQEKENDVLENKIICSEMIIAKSPGFHRGKIKIQ